MPFGPSWRFPDWDDDATGVVSKTEVPEAGGWIFKFRDRNSQYTHVFVPDMSAWAFAMAEANVNAQKGLVVTAITLDLTRVRRAKQPIPKE